MKRLRVLLPVLLISSLVEAQRGGTSPPGHRTLLSLEQAAKYDRQGAEFLSRGELGRAEESFRRALGIRERLAPGALALAASYHSMGDLLSDRGDLVAAESWYRKAMKIREAKAPGSAMLAASYHSIGILLSNRVDYAGAESWYRKAREIWEAKAPGSLDLAASYHSTGFSLHRRGDLAGAESWYRKAREIWEAKAPGSLDLATNYHNTGVLLQARGDLVAAESWYRKALKIREAKAPGAPILGTSYHSMGDLLSDRGDLVEAESWYRKALKIREAKAPGSPMLAASYDSLGDLLIGRGDLNGAESWYRKAQEIWKAKTPGSLELASSYSTMGLLFMSRNDFAAAESWYRKALKIREAKAPGSLELEGSYYIMGVLFAARGDLAGAESWALKASEILDSQRSQVVAPSSRILLTESNFSGAPSLLVSIRLDQNRIEEALEAIERFRGRGLSESLYERAEFAPEKDLPKELLTRQAELDGRLRRAHKAQEKGKDMVGELNLIRAEQRDLESQVRVISPRYASLKYPQTLDGKATLAALDEGTLLLDYVLLQGEAYLLAGTRDGVKSKKLEISPKDLDQRLRQYWSDLASQKPVLKEGKALYDLLVRPAQKELDACKRVLVCPQGWLGFVPLGALVADPGAQQATGPEDLSKATFLSDLRPLHHSVSVTAYADGRRFAPKDPVYKYDLLAFGSPDYHQGTKVPRAPEAEKAANLGKYLKSLKEMVPGLERLKNTSGPKSELLLGKDATVANLFARAPQARVLHFAVHGEAKDYDPLGSSLALTPAGGDDGFLRAGDVLAKLRLSSDLVVLCACQTALGRTSRTEGVDGLTRSFLAAGARSVVSSLWNAYIPSSEALFASFYARLKKGESKDQALRGAQRDVRKDPRWAHPYFWAPFLLHGDWK